MTQSADDDAAFIEETRRLLDDLTNMIARIRRKLKEIERRQAKPE